MKKSNAPGHKQAKYAPKSKPSGGNINKSNEMRSDGAKKVSSGHPFPKGLS